MCRSQGDVQVAQGGVAPLQLPYTPPLHSSSLHYACLCCSVLPCLARLARVDAPETVQCVVRLDDLAWTRFKSEEGGNAEYYHFSALSVSTPGPLLLPRCLLCPSNSMLSTSSKTARGLESASSCDRQLIEISMAATAARRSALHS